MGFCATPPAPEKGDLTAKNRVWGFFGEAQEMHRANRAQSLQLRQGNRLAPTKVASGRTYWPSRDPISENGGVNIYSKNSNDDVNYFDYLGLSLMMHYYKCDKENNSGFLVIREFPNLLENVVVLPFKSGGGKDKNNKVTFPIPNGGYNILSDAKEHFYRLEARDDVYGDDKEETTGRTAFRLHYKGRGVSEGCIGATDDDWQWPIVEKRLESTSSIEAAVKRGGRLRFIFRVEYLTLYGTLTVSEGSKVKCKRLAEDYKKFADAMGKK